MALTWQPDAVSLQQIMILLKESQSSDTKTQQELKPVSETAPLFSRSHLYRSWRRVHECLDV